VVFGSGVWLRIAYAGGVTLFLLAQASRSAGEWQQHLVQQWWAVMQPQPRLWQGNGTEVSLLRISTFGQGIGSTAEQNASKSMHETAVCQFRRTDFLNLKPDNVTLLSVQRATPMDRLESSPFTLIATLQFQK